MTEVRPPQAGTPGAGGQFEPPPITAFAWRHGLVRPSHGRLLAGVCGAFGRATNTDPVLWRVVIAVLTIFGGIGALAYLIAWLLLPADGDTASPIEALAGRGWSGTSTVLTIIGGVIVVFSLAAYLSNPFRATPLLAVVLLGGALLLLLRDQRGRVRAAGPVVAPVWTAASGPTAAGVVPPAGDDAPTAAGGEQPTVTAWPAPPPSPPPFAPHGPFVPTPPPPFVPVAPPLPPPPRPRRPRSRLALLTLSVMALALGTLALVDLAGVSVAGANYPAVALAVVGLGLVIGAWLGRARGLIAVGIILVFVLGGTIAGSHVDRHGWVRGGTTTWVPASLDSVRDTYRQDVGDATLDLTRVDFSSADSKTIDVNVGAGSLTIRVPSNVDVTVEAQVDAGNANVFRESWGGLGSQSHTVTDLGADGPGGGKLIINAKVNLGNLEVHR